MSIIPTQYDWIYQLYVEEQTKKQHNTKTENIQHTESDCCGGVCENCKNKNIESYESKD